MKRLALCAALLLAGCGVSQESIYAAKTALTAAEHAATNYITLPLCPQPSGICSEKAISDKIKAADQVAYGAVQSLSSGKISLTQATDAINGVIALVPVRK